MTVSVRASIAHFIGSPTLTVVAGPDTGRHFDLSGTEIVIGSDPEANVWLSDPTVSQRHCTIRIAHDGISIHDLGSTNGTRVGGFRIEAGHLKAGALIALGNTHFRFHGGVSSAVEGPDSNRLGLLLGTSPAMRRLFEQMRMVAKSDATVLIVGETGTGKELVAETLHELSNRSSGPFAVFDCAAVSSKLIESELFGHERGAFTGATEKRVGVVEEPCFSTKLASYR